MPIDFPDTPTNGDRFTSGGKTWQYDGTKWVAIAGLTSIGTGSITTEKLADGAVTSAKLASGALDPSTTAITGGTPSTIQFHVLGAVDAGGV